MTEKNVVEKGVVNGIQPCTEGQYNLVGHDLEQFSWGNRKESGVLCTDAKGGDKVECKCR